MFTLINSRTAPFDVSCRAMKSQSRKRRGSFRSRARSPRATQGKEAPPPASPETVFEPDMIGILAFQPEGHWFENFKELPEVPTSSEKIAPQIVHEKRARAQKFYEQLEAKYEHGAHYFLPNAKILIAKKIQVSSG